MQVDIFGWIEKTQDPMGPGGPGGADGPRGGPGGPIGGPVKETELPSLADPSNLVQLNFWQLKQAEVQTVVWMANINR